MIEKKVYECEFCHEHYDMDVDCEDCEESHEEVQDIVKTFYDNCDGQTNYPTKIRVKFTNDRIKDYVLAEDKQNKILMPVV